MKFSKFVKSLAPDGGAIYEYMDERWLASPSVLMLIPDDEDQLVGIIFPCEYAEQLNFYTMKEDKNNG